MATVSKSARYLSQTLVADSAGPFSLGFRMFDDDALEVYVNGEVQTLGADYTISSDYSDGYDDSASITFTTTLQTGDELIAYGAMVADRQDDLRTGGLNMIADLDIELARLAAMVSEMQTKVSRAFLFQEPLSQSIAAAANGYLGFDASGNPTLLTGDISGVAVSAAMEPVVTAGTLTAARTALGVAPASTGTIYGAYGGTANAITLTTGLGLTSLTTGMEFRFYASAANTGAATINIDGIGAVNLRTVSNSALPADYIRTDRMTIGWYNGSNIILSRVVESGTNSNGSWTRLEDGTQICSIKKLTLASTGGAAASGTWTFPKAFSSASDLAPIAILRPPFDSDAANQIADNYAGISDMIGPPHVGLYTTSSVSFRVARINGMTDFVSGNDITLSAYAKGYWY